MLEEGMMAARVWDCVIARAARSSALKRDDDYRNGWRG